MNSSPYRVLYLNHAAKASGAEFALWRMLGASDRRRVQPLVLFGEEGPAVNFMREIGVETHVLPLTGKVREVRKDTLGVGALLHVGRLGLIAAYAARVAAFAQRHRVQVIHTNTIKAHLYGALAGRMAGLPVVWHLRDYVNEAYFPRAAVKLVRVLARFAPRHIIGVSRSVMDQLHLNDGRKRSTVILDGLGDQELRAEMNPAPQPGGMKKVRVGIVGRLARWKGQHVFVEAAGAIVKAGYDAEFVVIGAPLFGEENYAASLRQQAQSLGIADRVEFRGFTRDVVGELRKLDVLVHASTTGEPFGQVIIEGMAVGLPVVASDGGGVPEIITHRENGLLTPMGDADTLARTLCSLFDDPSAAQRLGRAGYEHVRRHFRASEGARQVANIYEKILPRKRAATPVRQAAEALGKG